MKRTSISLQTRGKDKHFQKECSSREERGKSFLSNLLSTAKHEHHTAKKKDSIPKQHVVTLTRDDSDVGASTNVDDCNVKKSTLIDICLRNNNFETLHGLLAKAQLPRVDSNIQHYSIKCIKGEIEAKPDDPLIVDRVPPSQS